MLNAENSSLAIESGVGGGSLRSAVGGIDFDRQGNLWFTNSVGQTQGCMF